MPSLNANSGTILILQILTSAFLAILFLQSGIDKVADVAVTLNFFEVIRQESVAGMVPCS